MSTTNWGAVDRDPNAAARYLDAVSAAIGPIKARSIELLGLKPGAQVLEAGCGLGRDAETIADLVGPDGMVTGTDLSHELIGKALARTEAKRDRVNFKVAEIYDLPFHAATFDAARVDRVLQHLEEPAAAVAQLAWVVRGGGRIVLLEPDWESLRVGGVDKLITRAVASHIADNRHRSGMVGRDLAVLLSEAGCHDIKVEVSGMVVPDLGTMDYLTSLGLALREVVAAGKVSDDAAAQWWGKLQEHDVEKCFFGSVTGTIAVATVSG